MDKQHRIKRPKTRRPSCLSFPVFSGPRGDPTWPVTSQACLSPSPPCHANGAPRGVSFPTRGLCGPCCVGVPALVPAPPSADAPVAPSVVITNAALAFDLGWTYRRVKNVPPRLCRVDIMMVWSSGHLCQTYTYTQDFLEACSLGFFNLRFIELGL